MEYVGLAGRFLVGTKLRFSKIPALWSLTHR